MNAKQTISELRQLFLIGDKTIVQGRSVFKDRSSITVAGNIYGCSITKELFFLNVYSVFKNNTQHPCTRSEYLEVKEIIKMF